MPYLPAQTGFLSALQATQESQQAPKRVPFDDAVTSIKDQLLAKQQAQIAAQAANQAALAPAVAPPPDAGPGPVISNAINATQQGLLPMEGRPQIHAQMQQGPTTSMMGQGIMQIPLDPVVQQGVQLSANKLPAPHTPEAVTPLPQGVTDALPAALARVATPATPGPGGAPDPTGLKPGGETVTAGLKAADSLALAPAQPHQQSGQEVVDLAKAQAELDNPKLHGAKRVFAIALKTLLGGVPAGVAEGTGAFRKANVQHDFEQNLGAAKMAMGIDAEQTQQARQAKNDAQADEDRAWQKGQAEGAVARALDHEQWIRTQAEMERSNQLAQQEKANQLATRELDIKEKQLTTKADQTETKVDPDEEAGWIANWQLKRGEKIDPAVAQENEAAKQALDTAKAQYDEAYKLHGAAAADSDTDIGKKHKFALDTAEKAVKEAEGRYARAQKAYEKAKEDDSKKSAQEAKVAYAGYASKVKLGRPRGLTEDQESKVNEAEAHYEELAKQGKLVLNGKKLTLAQALKAYYKTRAWEN